MIRFRFPVICLLLNLACGFAYAADPVAEFEARLPTLTDPVMDTAGIVSSAASSQLNGILRQLRSQGGPQIVVLTLDDLGGLPIEQASIRIVEKWQLGSKEQDNGVLVLISKNDRAMRIEVGQGLEGDLPDAYAKRIIDQLMIPAFRQGNFDQGILAAVEKVIELTAPDFAAQGTGLPRQAIQGREVRVGWFQMLWLIVAAWFFLFTRAGRWLLMMMLFSSRGSSSHRGWGSRGGFGGGGGFGGFGGGGGGFSGGGASGRW